MKIADFPASAARASVAAALAEDRAADDITTLWSVPAGLIATAEISTRQPGVAAGLPVVPEVFAQTDAEVEVETLVADGVRLRAGDVLVRLTGSARSLITAERTVLNFLQRLCGIATVTDGFVQAVDGTPARILDTRKTAPGLRALDKYAVTAGGGSNHRLTLAATVLLKENHITAAGGVTAAINAVWKGMADSGTSVPIDVEVQTVAQAREAMEAGAGWLMLDNMEVGDIEEVMRMRAGRSGGSEILLEASGNVTLDRVRAIADAGVDLISIGALTHSAPALDLTMLITMDAAPCPR
ncbi:carboxylating nicotinate-nucleotide diphosphorylase [Streptomyces sp. NPDC056121]|uniref:carboxylating nicotinate-nucleotide diphosphorylase n=1 Tax=unclassified Streptomyces TaxID=2593676 RepID=UPI0035D72F10